MSEPIRVKLSEPILAHGEEIHELVLERPRMKHMKARDGAAGPVEASIQVVARLANVPPSSIEMMTPEDFQKVEQALLPFFAAFVDG